MCTVEVLCISTNCSNGYVWYELGSWTFGIETLPSEFLYETHIYTVTIDCDGDIHATDSATFKINIFSLKSTFSPINIWLPSTAYYKFFRKILPYKMIAPYDYIGPNDTTANSSSNETGSEFSLAFKT